MISFIEQKRPTFVYKAIASFVAFAFFFGMILPPGTSYAQLAAPQMLNLPAPGTMLSPTQGFMPTLIKGITIHPDNPLQFDFIVDTGDTGISGDALRSESNRLIKYFLASLTIPENELWVNLSPYEEGRVISDNFGQTEMGRDLLAQDYLLKQLTASLMYPENDLGKKFWDRVYKKAYEKFGTTEIPMNTFNKVWIVPKQAVVYEHEGSVYVIKNTLKVMLEEDFVALQHAREGGVPATELSADLSGDDSVPGKVSSQVMREILLPEIEKEVNEGETFANLRQISNSMVLAAWYKQNLQKSLLGQVYVDKAKVKGVDIKDKQINQKIYDQYIAAFKKGVYNYIKEDYDQNSQQVIPRKYFSGGAVMEYSDTTTTLRGNPSDLRREDFAMVSQSLAPQGKVHRIGVNLVDVGANAVPDEVAKADTGKAVLPLGISQDHEDFAMAASTINVADLHADVDHFAEKLGLVSSDVAYVKGLAAKLDPSFASDKLIIGKNFFPSALLTPEERQKLLGARDYATQVHGVKKYEEAARKVVLRNNPLDGGLGSNLKRVRYLKKLIRRENIAAKGTDLFYELNVPGFGRTGKPIWVKELISITEAKYLAQIRGSGDFDQSIIEELVNDDSIGPMNDFLDTIYLFDRVDKRIKKGDKRTYRDIIKMTKSIQLAGEMIKQGSLPVLDPVTGRLTTDYTAPGGHGQLGSMALQDVLDAKLPKDRVLIRTLYNGDGLNNSIDRYIAGYMAAEKAAIVMVSTTKTRLDTKGGLIGIQRMPDGKVRAQMLEKAQAEENKQFKDLFVPMGLEGGKGEAGGQFFNTNVAAINYTVLQPFLRELKKIIGEQKFNEIVTPDLIQNEKTKDGGRKVIQLEGAMGSALLNLNGFVTTTDNKKVQNLMKKHGFDRLLHIVNLDPVSRTEFFTPTKFAWDHWLYAKSGLFRLDLNTFKLVKVPNPQKDPGHLPGFDLDDHYKDLANVYDAFEGMDIRGLDFLTIKGEVDMRNSVVRGNVSVYNLSGERIRLSADDTKDAFSLDDDGKIIIDNKTVVIDHRGKAFVFDHLDDKRAVLSQAIAQAYQNAQSDAYYKVYVGQTVPMRLVAEQLRDVLVNFCEKSVELGLAQTRLGALAEIISSRKPGKGFRDVSKFLFGRFVAGPVALRIVSEDFKDPTDDVDLNIRSLERISQSLMLDEQLMLYILSVGGIDDDERITLQRMFDVNLVSSDDSRTRDQVINRLQELRRFSAALARSRERRLKKTGVEIKFGTSGWRGVIGKDFVWDNIARAAQGTASYMREAAKGKRILIGSDTRRDNPVNRRKTAEVMAGNGIRSTLVTGPVATPVLAYLASIDQDVGGVVNLTASHNPKESNGFKFSPEHGGAADKSVTDRISQLSQGAKAYKAVTYKEAIRGGLIQELDPEEANRMYVHDYLIPKLEKVGAMQDMVAFIKANPDFELILDPMQGTAVGVMKLLYAAIAEKAGREFYTMIHQNNNDPDFTEVPGGPRPDLDASNAALRETVGQKKNRLGIAADGDSDRFGTADFGGSYVSSNDLIAMLAYFMKKDSGYAFHGDTVGKTVGTSNFVNAVAEYLGLKVIETPVGFKYMVENATKNGVEFLIAGEESAHVGIDEFMQTWDDGIVVGLMTFWMTAKTGKTLSEYKAEIESTIGQRFRIQPSEIKGDDDSVKAPVEAMIAQTKEEVANIAPDAGDIITDRKILEQLSVIQRIERLQDQQVVKLIKSDGIKVVFTDGAWLLMRPSGTEPKIKLYVEAAFPVSETPSQEKIDGLNSLAQTIVGVDEDNAMVGSALRENFVRGFLKGVEAGTNTFAMIKPDGVEFKETILARLRASGLTVVELNPILLDKETAETLYEKHRTQPWFRDPIPYVTRSEVVPLLITSSAGEAVEKTRAAINAIRKELLAGDTENRIYGSDTIEEALRETKLILGKMGYFNGDDSAMVSGFEDSEIVRLVDRLNTRGIKPRVHGRDLLDFGHNAGALIKHVVNFSVLKDPYDIRRVLLWKLSSTASEEQGKTAEPPLSGIAKESAETLYNAVFDQEKFLKTAGKDKKINIVLFRREGAGEYLTNLLKTLPNVNIKIMLGATDDGGSWFHAAREYNATGIPTAGKVLLSLATAVNVREFLGARLDVVEDETLLAQDLNSIIEGLLHPGDWGFNSASMKSLYQKGMRIEIDQRKEIAKYLKKFFELLEEKRETNPDFTLSDMPVRSMVILGAAFSDLDEGTGLPDWQGAVDCVGKLSRVKEGNRVMLPTRERQRLVAVREDGTIHFAETSLTRHPSRYRIKGLWLLNQSIDGDFIDSLQRQFVENKVEIKLRNVNTSSQEVNATTRKISPAEVDRFVEQMNKISSTKGEEKVSATSEVVETLQAADIILYSSVFHETNIAPALIVPGVGEAIQQNEQAVKIHLGKFHDVDMASLKLADVASYLHDRAPAKEGQDFSDDISLYIDYYLGGYEDAVGTPPLLGKIVQLEDRFEGKISAVGVKTERAADEESVYSSAELKEAIVSLLGIKLAGFQISDHGKLKFQTDSFSETRTTAIQGQLGLFRDDRKVDLMIEKMRRNLASIKSNGVFVFDVDMTILPNGAKSMTNYSDLAYLFMRLLREGIRVVIISGNSRERQMKRIVDAIKIEMKDDQSGFENLTFYVSGGATKIAFDKEGNEIWDRAYNIRNSVPDVKRLRGVLEESLKNLVKEKFATREDAPLTDEQMQTFWKAGIARLAHSDVELAIPGNDWEIQWIAASRFVPEFKATGPWFEKRGQFSTDDSEELFGSLAIKPILDVNGIDIRGRVIRAMKKALKDAGMEEKFSVRSAGVSTIEITSKKSEKATALKDFIKGNRILPNWVFYFGNEFDPNGNDWPIAEFASESGVNVLAVDMNTQENLHSGVLHIGMSPQAIQEFFEEFFRESHGFARVRNKEVEVRMMQFLDPQVMGQEYRDEFLRGIMEGYHTVAMIKPDGIKFKDIILRDLQKAGFQIVQGPNIRLSREIAETFYSEHEGKTFYNDLLDYISDGEVIPLFLEYPKKNAVEKLREVYIQIREKLHHEVIKNRIHASDSIQSAFREAKILFSVIYRQMDEEQGQDNAMAASTTGTERAGDDSEEIQEMIVDMLVEDDDFYGALEQVEYNIVETSELTVAGLRDLGRRLKELVQSGKISFAYAQAFFKELEESDEITKRKFFIAAGRILEDLAAESKHQEETGEVIALLKAKRIDEAVSAVSRLRGNGAMDESEFSAMGRRIQAGIRSSEIEGLTARRFLKNLGPERGLGQKFDTEIERVLDYLADHFDIEDDAMVAKASEKGPVGGIDLDPNLLDMQIKRDGRGIPLPINDQPLQDMNIGGFIPVIINVTPVMDLPLIMGFKDDGDAPDTVTQDRPLSPADRPEQFTAVRRGQVAVLN